MTLYNNRVAPYNVDSMSSYEMRLRNNKKDSALSSPFKKNSMRYNIAKQITTTAAATNNNTTTTTIANIIRNNNISNINTLSRIKNDECPECRENGIIVCDSSEGTQLCSTCGLVIESNVVFDEQEWRNFGNDDSGKGNDRNRVGEVTDVWLENSIIGTTFIKANKKLQNLNMMTQMNKSDQTLISAFHILKTICDTFSLRSNVVERAKEITKELQDLQQLKTRTNTLNMLAVVYLACREAGQIKSIKELIGYDRSFKEKDLGKTINKLKKVLPMRSSAYNENISHLIYSLSNRLKLSEELIEVIEFVVKRATTLITTSHRLNSLCGGSIYMVVEINSHSNEEYVKLPSLSQIAAVCGVTSNTLKTTFKELLNAAEYILPKHYITECADTLMTLKQKYLADEKKKKKKRYTFTKDANTNTATRTRTTATTKYTRTTTTTKYTRTTTITKYTRTTTTATYTRTTTGYATYPGTNFYINSNGWKRICCTGRRKCQR